MDYYEGKTKQTNEFRLKPSDWRFTPSHLGAVSLVVAAVFVAEGEITHIQKPDERTLVSIVVGGPMVNPLAFKSTWKALSRVRSSGSRLGRVLKRLDNLARRRWGGAGRSMRQLTERLADIKPSEVRKLLKRAKVDYLAGDRFEAIQRLWGSGSKLSTLEFEKLMSTWLKARRAGDSMHAAAASLKKVLPAYEWSASALETGQALQLDQALEAVFELPNPDSGALERGTGQPPSEMEIRKAAVGAALQFKAPSDLFLKPHALWGGSGFGTVPELLSEPTFPSAPGQGSVATVGVEWLFARADCWRLFFGSGVDAPRAELASATGDAANYYAESSLLDVVLDVLPDARIGGSVRGHWRKGPLRQNQEFHAWLRRLIELQCLWVDLSSEVKDTTGKAIEGLGDALKEPRLPRGPLI